MPLEQLSKSDMFFPTYITKDPPNIYRWLMDCLKGNKVIIQQVLFIMEALKISDSRINANRGTALKGFISLMFYHP